MREEREISQLSAGSLELNRIGQEVNMKEVIRHSGEMVWETLREFPGKGEITTL